MPRRLNASIRALRRRRDLEPAVRATRLRILQVAVALKIIRQPEKKAFAP